VFPVRYGLNVYLLFDSNLCFKALGMSHPWDLRDALIKQRSTLLKTSLINVVQD
jgi:hypothetical protein